MINCPWHDDGNPSCQVNEENLFCHGCGGHGDIYDLLEVDQGLKTIPEKERYLQDFYHDAPPIITAPKDRQRPVTGTPVPLHPDKAKDIFNRKSIIKVGGMSGVHGEPGEPVFYKDQFGEIMGADVRFEDPKKGKQVLTFWWDSHNLKTRGAPVLVYGREKLRANPDKPVLIVEGVKCAVAAEQLDEFVSMTWSRGGRNAKYADWECVQKREVYVYPDDDKPGRDAAIDLRREIPHARIVEPMPEARAKKAKGADIVEALEVASPEEITEYILTGGAESVESHEPVTTQPVKRECRKILGTGDDGLMWALDRDGRLCSYRKSKLTKNELLTIAPLGHWSDLYPGQKGGVDWTLAQDDILMESSGDFDLSTVRGRGAWNEKDGSICYNDGSTITGDASDKRLYIRKKVIDIGVADEHAAAEVLQKIAAMVRRMTFETGPDGCRLLAWSALAPFGGALPWRPALLVTGESGSGKSRIMDLLMRPISAGITRSGSSTEAGIRQTIGNDSCAVIIEEAEGENQSKNSTREALFSLMRQSTTDDSPMISKGTAGDQRGISFAMHNMFCFLAIDPTIAHAADDNRIFRINLVKATTEQEDDFKSIEREIPELLDEKTCRGIRALMFSKLPQIIDTAMRIRWIIRDVSKDDVRFGLADGLLWATYWLLWEGRTEITDEDAREFLAGVYEAKPKEPRRNESIELLDRLMDQQIPIAGDFRRTMTIREACYYSRDGELDGEEVPSTTRADIASSLARHGIRSAPEGVVIAARHHELEKIAGTSEYTRLLWRHPDILEKSKRIRIAGAQRSCCIIRDVLDEHVGWIDRAAASGGNTEESGLADGY